MITKFSDLAEGLFEAKIVAKRKYTEKHPEVTLSSTAPLRNKILEFVDSRGTVSKKEFNEFLDQIGETTGKKPSKRWLVRNEHLLTKKTKGDDVSYSLSKRGKKVLEMTKRLMEDAGHILTWEEIEGYIDSELDVEEDEIEIEDEEIAEDVIDEVERFDGPDSFIKKMAYKYKLDYFLVDAYFKKYYKESPKEFKKNLEKAASQMNVNQK